MDRQRHGNKHKKRSRDQLPATSSHSGPNQLKKKKTAEEEEAPQTEPGQAPQLTDVRSMEVYHCLNTGST